jgi:serine/threonine protein kinase
MNAEQPDSDVPQQRVSEVLGAYLEAVDAGWAPPQHELLARYPDLVPELAAFFAGQEQLVRLANPSWLPPPSSAPANGPAQQKMGPPAAEQPTTLPMHGGTLLGPGGDAGRSVGNYELLEMIGHGGMGVVYKAWQLTAKRFVALKMIRAGRFASADDVRRFYNEVEAAGNLDHPHIVPIYEVGEHQGQPYFSMKLFEAGSLTGHLPRLAKDLHAAGQLLAMVARAVHHAHLRGILHRDLKPGNILLDAQGQPQVTDFGLAKRLEKPGEPGIPRPEAAGDSVPGASEQGTGPTTESTAVETPPAGLVPSGFAGTPSYTAPEQAAGRKGVLTTAADVYSLGAILYRILTGRPPFQATTSAETRRQVQELQPQRPRAINPRVDRNLEAVCLKCLEKDPAKRYASAEALAEDLQRWLRREPVLARRPPWPMRVWRTVRRHALPVTAAALCGFAVAAVLLYSYFTDPERPLEEMERRLARGEKVTLVEATGAPRWSRWTEGEDIVMVPPPERDKPFSFAAFTYGRLKLLRSPQGARYRFSAEVRHEAGTSLSKVGIYFAYKTLAVGQHVERYWCELTFADLGSLAGSFRGPQQKPDERPQYSKVALILRRHAELQQPFENTVPTPIFKDYLDEKPTPNLWRRLAVEVTPERIRAFWRDELIGELPLATLRFIGKAMPGAPAGLNPAFEFAPDGALGLYVYRGEAAFRNIVVEPLK